MIKWLIGFVGLCGEVLQHFFYIAYMLEKEFRKNKIKQLDVSSSMKNTEEELDNYMAENDDDSFLVYMRYKYDFEEEWDYSVECAAWNACEDTISWLNDWYEGQQNVEYLAISKLGEEYDC